MAETMPRASDDAAAAIRIGFRAQVRSARRISVSRGVTCPPSLIQPEGVQPVCQGRR